MRVQIITVFVIITLLIWGCLKAPPFPDQPSIKFKSINKNLIKYCVDTLVITFEFQDGDGDLGFPEADSTSDIFLKLSVRELQQHLLMVYSLYCYCIIYTIYFDGAI